MTIENVLIASNKRFEIMHKMQKSEALNTWATNTSLATWVGGVAANSIAPNGTVAIVIGSAFLTSVAALTALQVQKGLRKKSIRNLETTIIEHGKEKEKHQAARLNATEKLNNKIIWAYSLGGIAMAGVGFQVIEAFAPSLGVAWMKAALLISTGFGSYKLGSNAAEKAGDAREDRSTLAERIAKRNGADINTTTEPKVSTVKFR